MIESISGDIMSPIKRLPSGEKERLAVWLPLETASLIRTYCANLMSHSKLVNDAVMAYIRGGAENAKIQDSERKSDGD